MEVTFKNIIPAPLEGVAEPESEIWNTNLSLDSSQRCQAYAPSGKGKSTFIHLIYGLRFDYKGEITLENKNTKKISSKEWANYRQNKFSIVFQDLRLFLHLTALENIQVNAVLYGKVNENEINSMADFLGISHVLNKKASTLSYGERQRTALIRALIQPFEWLLLDEPFSHLDEGNIRKACELIDKKCQEQKAGILMTSLGYPYFLEFDQKLRL